MGKHMVIVKNCLIKKSVAGLTESSKHSKTTVFKGK